MRRAALAIATTLTALAAAPYARAGCSSEVATARQQVETIQDAQHRQEATLLLDKAENDARAGRERLCIDALVRAQQVVH